MKVNVSIEVVMVVGDSSVICSSLFIDDHAGANERFEVYVKTWKEEIEKYGYSVKKLTF